jgi:hypothetical protein
MPRAIEFRVVSLPATTNRLKNITNSRSVSGSNSPSSPSMVAPTTALMMSWPGHTFFSSMNRFPYSVIDAAARLTVSLLSPSSLPS